MISAGTAGRAIRAGALALALAGCGALGGGQEAVSLDSLSAEQIYLRAEAELEAGEPQTAAQTFAEVERLSPYSDFAQRALIMQAFSHHRDRAYEDSRAAAQRSRACRYCTLE